ncbi:hypothetical protein CAter282_3781 [Collimonas arenae]|uniref:Alpha/beta hydrolase family protein n=1 Tax=Collimonas arenae TaxID=279058 RepID=A0A127PVD1_9BURK|nr:alpha/beta hydrolase [Collimonas arenae]AMP01565.1 hypothetical protein CAter10_4129 [Collimonas arenae]AMP11459.1 hypothetical protein CAter282_3781 [Collimonas arenae]
MNMLRTISISAWLAMLPMAAGATVDPEVLTPVPIVQDGRLEVSSAKGEGVISIHVSRDWTQPQPAVTRAVIVIHGWPRRDLKSLELAAEQSGTAANDAILITPQFLIQADIDAHHLPADTLRWGPNAWAAGYDARGPAAISSFDALDAILARLANRQLFPALRTVVVAGHSAGGRFVQRYAAVGHGQGPLLRLGVHLSYVVANPSDYLYLTPERPIDTNRHADGASSQQCPGVNRWPYGLGGDLPRYVSQPIDPQALGRDYLARDIVYLLGTADNDPAHHQLDRSCAAEVQGTTRFDRGTLYFSYLSSRPRGEWTQRLLEVAGIGHNSVKMFSSACGRAALFDQDGCAPDPDAAAYGQAQGYQVGLPLKRQQNVVGN